MRFISFLLLFAFMLPSLIGQEHIEGKIDAIQFIGLKKTDHDYINQFIDINLNEEFSVEDIERNTQYIKNLTGISNATASLDTVKGKIRLVFNVEEVKTLLPVINFGGITDNKWYEVGFLDYNWKGRGQILTATYQNNNGLHSGQVYYKVPMINKSTWGYSAGLSSWNSEEPLYFDGDPVNYNYRNNSASGTLIKNFGINRNIEGGGTLFLEQYEKSENQILEDVPGPEGLSAPKFLSKLVYTQNKINYHFFYRSGYAYSLTYQNVFNFNDETTFNSLQFNSVKYFRPKEKVNIAFRLILAVSTNNDTPFAPFVADSHVNIRGIGNRIDRGTAQIVLNAEYRYTIFSKKKWHGQIIAFSDVGNWREPGGDLSQLVSNIFLRQFVGGGARLIFQDVFDAVLRIDYGVDVFNPRERGVVIGIGQYF